MNAKKFNALINRIRQDSRLRPGEKLVICLNRACNSSLEDARLLTADGKIQNVFSATGSGDRADDAAVRLTEDGYNLVGINETRSNSRDGRPNGIRLQLEELNVPCVVCFNSGKERLTVDGKWVDPGEYTAFEEADINSLEVQKALDEFIRSPEVQEEIEEVRRAVAEKRGRR